MSKFQKENVFFMILGITIFIGILSFIPVLAALSANENVLLITTPTHAETYMLQNNGSIQLYPNAPQTCNATLNNGSIYYDGADFYTCKGTGWTAFPTGSITDTNETTRMNNIATFACGGTDKISSFGADGTPVCTTDEDSGGGGSGSSKWVDTGDYLQPNSTYANGINVTSLSYITEFSTFENNMKYNFYDDGNNIILNSSVGGNNHFGIHTTNALMYLTDNPNPGNDYILFAVSEDQGATTDIHFYEGGTTHNRIWSSGSVRIGGGESSVCTEITGDVDCDTPNTGADLVVQDMLWVNNTIFSHDWSNVTITESQISDLTHTIDTHITNDSIVITESQISDLSHTTDTNETTRFNNLIITCTGDDKISAIGADGTPTCSTDQTGGGGSGDKWVDNGLYITPNSTFANSTRLWGNMTIVIPPDNDLLAEGHNLMFLSQNQSSKGGIAWYTQNNNPMAWIVAHNTSLTDPNEHQHLSIETTDETYTTGGVKTRLGFDWGKSDSTSTAEFVNLHRVDFNSVIANCTGTCDGYFGDDLYVNDKAVFGNGAFGETGDAYVHIIQETKGSLPSLSSGTGLLVQRNDITSRASVANILAGTAGWSILEFGDTNDANTGRIQYAHSTNTMTIRTNTADAISIDSNQNVTFTNDVTADTFKGIFETTNPISITNNSNTQTISTNASGCIIIQGSSSTLAVC